MKKNIHIFYAILLALPYFFTSSCQSVTSKNKMSTYSLNGTNWFFSEQDSTKQYSATVPGSVHMDLLNNKLIEEPYYRSNEKQLQWIGERNWKYTTKFTLPSHILSKNNVELCFDGLDTYATVFLNGKEILSANNYFREWVVNVKSLLNTNENSLEILFESPVGRNKKMLNADSIPLFDNYVYTRKPAFHFGWDWGPVFITSGIWRPVYVKAWDGAIITDFYVDQQKVSSEQAQLAAKFEIEAQENMQAALHFECNDAAISETMKVNLVEGKNAFSFPFVIKKPKLWWSLGLGEPNMYQFACSMETENNTSDSKTCRVGVRSLRLVQEPDSAGKSFYFELNGKPVYAKGANYIPQESFQSKVDSADYRTVIKHATDANMNMLRVWGGGFYEEDYFYDLCDENGIMVWQDFMFACSMYPGEVDFLENVRQEAIENIKRIRKHPSLALWCGNNENYIGWKDWRWSNRYSKADSAKVWNDYEKLFHDILPSVVEQHDPQRDYWPSSPKHGWGYPVNTDGDTHLWAVWHAQDPFEVFLEKENIGRFMSEYGFQSLPEMSTIEKFTLPNDRDITSEVMKDHQKHRVGYPVIDKYMERDYKKPKDFEGYVYVSQLLQAKGITMAIEAHRRAMPFCMGTLYWQLNDCWPVASWSSVDYYNNWKPLHYDVKNAYSTVLVSAVKNEGNLEIYAISDSLSSVSASLEIHMLDFNGKNLFEEKQDVSIPENGSKLIWSKPIAQLSNNIDTTQVAIQIFLKENKKALSENIWFFAKPKDLKLQKAKVVYKIEEKAKGKYVLKFTSDSFVKRLALSLNGEGEFTSNYFNLFPNQEKQVYITTSLKPDELRSSLSIKSLVDTY